MANRPKAALMGLTPLFEGISKLPPDDLEKLFKRLAADRPRTAAIIADVLQVKREPRIAPHIPERKLVAPGTPAKPRSFKPVTAEQAQGLVDGAVPEGFEALILEENPADLDP